MPTSPEKEIKVRALRELIKAGYHNSEIVDALADRYDITPEMIRCQRKHLKIPAPQEDRTPRTAAKLSARLGHRCPKCNGAILHGGVRNGLPAADIDTCVNCGLTNESGSYLNASTGMRVEL